MRGLESREFLNFSACLSYPWQALRCRASLCLLPSPCGRGRWWSTVRAWGFFVVLFLPSPVPMFQHWCSHNTVLPPAPLWQPVSALCGLLLAGILGCEQVSSPPPLAATCCLGLGGGTVSSPSPGADALLCISEGSGKQGAILDGGSRSPLCTPTPPSLGSCLALSQFFLLNIWWRKGVCQFPLLFILESLINCMSSFISSFSLMVSFLIHGLFRNKFHMLVGFFPPYICLIMNSSLILLFSESILC